MTFNLKRKLPILIVVCAFVFQKLSAGGFVELSSGYNLPFGEWSRTFGGGFCYGGMFGFTFSEYLNPGIGGLIIFPRTGKNIVDEYKSIQETEYISLFTATGFIYLENRMNFALSENYIFTFDIGYALHSQRDYATIIYNNYESIDNFSGYGPFVGFGLKRKITFSVFDYIQPFTKLYYSPNRVYYLIVDKTFSNINFPVAENRIGAFIGITLISIGEE